MSKDNITVFDKIMAAITYSEANCHNEAKEILDMIEEETTVSGVYTPDPLPQGG